MADKTMSNWNKMVEVVTGNTWAFSLFPDSMSCGGALASCSFSSIPAPMSFVKVLSLSFEVEPAMVSKAANVKMIPIVMMKVVFPGASTAYGLQVESGVEDMAIHSRYKK